MVDDIAGVRRLAAILAIDMVGFSRLMEADEDGTLARQRDLRANLIDPAVQRLHGRIFKTTGDGLLAEFSSATDAMACAAEVQVGIAAQERDAGEQAIRYRIGINMGDVVEQDDDLFGDGVNVAARLEALSPVGGVALADAVYRSVAGKLDLQFEDSGEQQVKNISKPVRVWTWRPVATDDESEATHEGPGLSPLAAEQDIRFCRAADGCQIAFATVGRGPPLYKAPNWLNHLEYDWRSPAWRHMLRFLADEHTLLRFDQRGTGLSDWDVPALSFEAMVDDMALVAEAGGFERGPLLGVSQGCAFSIAFAARYPERVSKLVLYGGFAKGWMSTHSETDKERFALQRQMIVQGWGQDNPAFLQFFSTLFMPEATRQQMDEFNQLQRTTTTPENAATLRDIFGSANVAGDLARITAPTLVLHCRNDGVVPFDAGRKMAAHIPGARFVPLEGDNHLILETDPAWPRFMQEVRTFLAGDQAAGSG